jgi:hypothetical protein
VTALCVASDACGSGRLLLRSCRSAAKARKRESDSSGRMMEKGRREDDWTELHTALMFTARARAGERLAITLSVVPTRRGRVWAPGQ